MAEAAIPVDLFNPGQVFACLGFVEAAEILLGKVEAAFDWRVPGRVQFRLRVEGDADPVQTVLQFLAAAEVSAVAPLDSAQSTEKPWGVPTLRLDRDAAFPYPDPPSPATLPARLTVAGQPEFLQIDHWGDATSRDTLKFWAGSGGYPGAALARDALELIRPQILDATADPFALAAKQPSSFRLDWRRDYIPIDVGFSPNEHRAVTMLGFPLVEILAAIGLGNARPQRGKTKLDYRYGVLGASAALPWFSPIFHRAALGAAKLPFLQRQFDMHLGWPGQEGQARCITDVTEEFNP